MPPALREVNERAFAKGVEFAAAVHVGGGAP
jgi:hypothetical protein